MRLTLSGTVNQHLMYFTAQQQNSVSTFHVGCCRRLDLKLNEVENGGKYLPKIFLEIFYSFINDLDCTHWLLMKFLL